MLPTGLADILTFYWCFEYDIRAQQGLVSFCIQLRRSYEAARRCKFFSRKSFFFSSVSAKSFFDLTPALFSIWIIFSKRFRNKFLISIETLTQRPNLLLWRLMRYIFVSNYGACKFQFKFAWTGSNSPLWRPNANVENPMFNSSWFRSWTPSDGKKGGSETNWSSWCVLLG